MNKEELTSLISKESDLSTEDTKKIIENIFKTIEECLRKNKNIEIKKFGEFKPIIKISQEGKKFKSVNFTPSKKLSKKINYNFDNLKKEKIEKDICNIPDPDEKLEYKISDDFKKQLKTKEEDEDISIQQDIEPDAESTKPIISDEVVKLHKEIIDYPDEKNNLWR